MPRTVEHIVACHQAASALRAAGKPAWSKTIDIKAILHEDQNNETPDHVSAVSVRIAALIRRKTPAKYFDVTDADFSFDFVDAIEEMEQCTVATLAQDIANGDEACERFNGWLETIYDWADEHRVWMGN